MKEQHMIYSAGEVVGKITARDPQRACLLFAAKRGGHYRDYVAVAAVADDARHAAAQQKSMMAAAGLMATP